MPTAPVPGVAVEHARAGDARREDVEQRLAQLVGRRPQPVPRRRLETPAFQRPGDDAHASVSGTRYGSTDWQSRSSVTRSPAIHSPDLDQLEPLLPASAACVERRRRRAPIARTTRAASRCATSSSSRSRTRSIMRNVGMPACRVPKKSPGPAQPQIALGDLEAVGRLGHRLQPLARLVRQRRLIQQEAVRLVAAAADAAAQLVQLRQAEALGVLDDHHARVRHVDADLDDRRRHEDLQLAARRTPSSRDPCASGLHPAVQQPDAVLRKHLLRQVIGHLGRGLEIDLRPTPRPADR